MQTIKRIKTHKFEQVNVYWDVNIYSVSNEAINLVAFKPCLYTPV